MNLTDYKAMARRIDRVQRTMHGIHQASEQALTELGDLQMMVGITISEMQTHRDDTERAPRNGRVAKSKPVRTEADVLRIIEGVFGKVAK